MSWGVGNHTSHVLFFILVPCLRPAQQRREPAATTPVWLYPTHVMSFPATTGFGLPTPCPEDKKAWQLAWSTMANPHRKPTQNAPVQSRFRRAEDNAKASAARSSHQWQQPGCPAHDDAYKRASSRWFLAARVDSHVGGCIRGSLSLSHHHQPLQACCPPSRAWPSSASLSSPASLAPSCKMAK